LADTSNYDESVKLVRDRGLDIREDALKPNISAIEGWPGRVIAYFDTMYRRIQSQRWLTYLLGVVTLLAIPLSVFRPLRHTVALGYCGVIIHGSMLLTAAVTVFIPRYALPVDPILLVAGVIVASGSMSWAIRTAKQRAGNFGFDPAYRSNGESP